MVLQYQVPFGPEMPPTAHVEAAPALHWIGPVPVVLPKRWHWQNVVGTGAAGERETHAGLWKQAQRTLNQAMHLRCVVINYYNHTIHNYHYSYLTTVVLTWLISSGCRMLWVATMIH